MLVAGCWQTRSRPYRGVQPLMPFDEGAVVETGPDRKPVRYTLAKIAGGRYRLTQTDRGQDFGQGFDLAFFPLPGAPSRVLVYEAAALDHPAADESLRYHGLLVLTGRGGAREIRPDCEKDAKAAAASGTVADKSGDCTFADRAALETSLLALWKSGKKPAYRWTFRSAVNKPGGTPPQPSSY